MSAKIPTALSLALLLVGAGAGAGADTLLKLESHRGAFDFQGEEQPAADTAIELWLGKDRIRRDDGRTAAILRRDQKRLLLVNHEDKTYTGVDLPIDFDAQIPEEFRQAAEMWKMTAKVTATDQRKKIGDWNARLYTVELTNAMGLAIRTELWASRDLAIDYDDFKELSLALAELQPGGGATAEELAKIDGFPVLQQISVDMSGEAMESTERLVSVEERDPPAGVYDPPAGYNAKEFDLITPPGAGP